MPQKATEPNTQTTVLRVQTANSKEKLKKMAKCSNNNGTLSR